MDNIGIRDSDTNYMAGVEEKKSYTATHSNFNSYNATCNIPISVLHMIKKWEVENQPTVINVLW